MARERRRKKENELCYLSSSFFQFCPIAPPPFRPSPIFRRLLFMCFSATASRQRRELPTRRGTSLHPFLSPFRFNPFSWTFENHSKGINDRAYDSNVKYFESVNRWKVYPFLFVSEGARFCHFLSVFPRVKSFRGLNCEPPWPSSIKETRAKLTLGNEWNCTIWATNPCHPWIFPEYHEILVL